MIQQTERINFPDYPKTDQVYSIKDMFWKYNGDGWVRQLADYKPTERMNDAITVFDTEQEFLLRYMDMAAGVKRGDVALVLETKSTYKNRNGTHSLDSTKIEEHWTKFIVKCSDAEGAGKIHVIERGDSLEAPPGSKFMEGWRRGVIVVYKETNASYICITDNLHPFDPASTTIDFDNNWTEIPSRRDSVTAVNTIADMLLLKDIVQGHVVVVLNKGRTFQSIKGGNGDIQEWEELLAAGRSGTVVIAEPGEPVITPVYDLVDEHGDITDEHGNPFGSATRWLKGTIVIRKGISAELNASFLCIDDNPEEFDIKSPSFSTNWVELTARKDYTRSVKDIAERDALVTQQGDVCIVEDESATYKYEGTRWIEISKMDNTYQVIDENSVTNGGLPYNIRQGDVVYIEKTKETFKNVTGSNTNLKTDWQLISIGHEVIEYAALTNVMYDLSATPTSGYPIVGTPDPATTIHEDISAKDWIGHPKAVEINGKGYIFIDKNHTVVFGNGTDRIYRWMGDKPALIGLHGESYTDPGDHKVYSTVNDPNDIKDFLVLIGHVSDNDVTMQFNTQAEFETYISSSVSKKGDIVVVLETGKTYKNHTGKNVSISTDWIELISRPIIDVTKPTPEIPGLIGGAGTIILPFAHDTVYNEFHQSGDIDVEIDRTNYRIGIKSYITYNTANPVGFSDNFLHDSSVPHFKWNISEFTNIPRMEYNTKYYLELTSMPNFQIRIDVIGFEAWEVR